MVPMEYAGAWVKMIHVPGTKLKAADTYALCQERAVFGKMKMDPAKRAQTQNAGEVSSLQWFFSQSIELMMDKVWLHCIRPMLLK